jgi:hypothetical protein
MLNRRKIRSGCLPVSAPVLNDAPHCDAPNKSSILAAVFDSEVSLNHQPDERIGIVAEIVVGIINWAAMEQIRTAAVLRRATRHDRPRQAGMHPGVPMLDLVASIGARPGQDGPADCESEHND